MNIPNLISLLRLILVPIITVLLLINGNGSITIGNFIITHTFLIAGILFIAASLSDFLDGYLARKWNQVTVFGKFFDAIADKLLTNLVLISMSYLGIIPIWITLILIARDFLIDVLRQILASKNIVMAANWYGKWKAALLMLGISLLFFFNTTSFIGSSTFLYGQYGLINQLVLIPTYLATILSLYSGFIYFYQNRENILQDKKG